MGGNSASNSRICFRVLKGQWRKTVQIQGHGEHSATLGEKTYNVEICAKLTKTIFTKNWVFYISFYFYLIGVSRSYRYSNKVVNLFLSRNGRIAYEKS